MLEGGGGKSCTRSRGWVEKERGKGKKGRACSTGDTGDGQIGLVKLDAHLAV